jgi:ElaB/YqjD/DUF883 family membrane-anchored ribosome-binding protein
LQTIGNHDHGLAFLRHSIIPNKGPDTMASYSTEDAQDQINALRKQVNQLMGDRVTPALHDAADRAQNVAKQATDYTKEQADTVAQQVRGRPLVAIALAGAVGYVLGRFVR